MATERAPDAADAFPFAVLSLDGRGVVVHANTAAARLWRRLVEDLVGQEIDALLGTLGSTVWHTELMPQLRRANEASEVLLPLRLDDGSTRELLAYARRDTPAGDLPASVANADVVLALLPVDRRRRTERELLRVRSAADAVPGMLFEWQVDADGRGRLPYASAGALEMVGLPPEALAVDDAPLLAMIDPEDLPQLLASRQDCAAAGRPCVMRVRMHVPHEGGRRSHWVQLRASPLPGPAGSTTWYGHVADITAEFEAESREREIAIALRAEAVRREAEDFAQAMLDEQPTLLAYWRADLTLGFANRAYCGWMGLDPERARGRPLVELFPPARVERNRVTVARVMAGERVDSEADVRSPDGREGRFLVQWVPRRIGPAIDGFFIVATDVTSVVEARRSIERAQSALDEAMAFSRTVADSIPGRVSYWGLDDRCRFVNRHFCEWYGWRPEQVLGRSATEIFGDDTERRGQDFAQAARGGRRGEFERRERDPAGEERDLLVQYIPDQRDGVVVGVVVMTTDITSTKEAQHRLLELNAELVEARDRAEAATRAKTAFLANMSHEIRTPMNAILGLTHLLARDLADPLARERLAKVERAGRHLLAVINSVLDLSKIEAGKMVLETVPFSLPVLLRGAVELVADDARDKGLPVDLDIVGLPDDLLGDPTRLSQVVVNLVANAVRYTMRGSVRVVAEPEGVEQPGQDGLMVRVSVVDTGPGLSEEQQSRLFQVFEQADASSTRRHGGTGLGLALTRRIAQAMGGEAGVSSRLGEGSTFWFTARLRRAPEGSDAERSPGWPPPATRPSLAPARATGAPGGRPRTPVPAPAEALPDDRAARLARGHRGARVLLAEDNPVNQEVAGELLHQAGLRVDIAENGAKAVELAAATAYDLVLMDVQMPVMDGIAAARAIRAFAGAALPIVAMTANAFGEDRAACLAAGMNDHVAKPVDPDALYDALLRWMPAAGPADEPGAALDAEPAPDAAPSVAATAAMPARLETLEARLRAIDGLDVDLALHQVGGQAAMLERMLRQFVGVYGAGLPALGAAGDGEARRRRAVAAHSLRGAGGTIGAGRLVEAVVAMERLLAADADSPEVESAGAVVQSRLDRLVAALRAALDDAAPPSPAAAAPATVSPST